MTHQEKQALIGKYATIHTGTVDEVKISITDVKEAYGNTRVFVYNPNGKGAWRNLDTLKLVNN